MKSIIIFSVITIIFSILFSLYPEVDLYFAKLLYNKEAGFFNAHHLFFTWIKEAVPLAVYFSSGILIAWLLFRVLQDEDFTNKTNRIIFYLLLSLALGPGLVVNGLLKEHWGRARPSQIYEFGGTKPFTPPLVPAPHCAHNCSFVSGHAAVGFYIISYAFIVRHRRMKRNIVMVAIFMGSLIGFVRMAQGAHFLSDIIFSAIFTTATAYILAHFILPKEKNRTLSK